MNRIAACIAVAAFGAGAYSTICRADPLRIESGMIDGGASSDGAMRVYKGVPYARPPVGDLRWRAPQPAEPWTGVRKTEAFAPICMQPDPPPGNSLFKTLFFTPAGPKSEDCLYLNIWTTATPGGPKQPVMVWIPGGGFRAGSASGPIYDGESLARRGVTVVSINYRLWKFGYLAHPGLTAESEHHASGNYGLMDQIATLQWVQRNIGAFDGDPAQVTIFGQSAGSYSVNYLVASPLAKGLFARAIGESGAAFAPATAGSIMGHTLLPLADAEKGGQRLADVMGAKSIAELRRKSPEDILAVPSPDRYESSWPMLDGYVLPNSVDNIFANGRQNDVPVLTGTNADEGSLFPSVGALAAYQDQARKNFGPRATEFLGLYPASSDADTRKASETAFRDTLAGWENWSWVRAQSKTGKAPIYYYYFTRKPPAPAEEQFTEHLGADVGVYHGAELAYVFGNFYPTTWAWSDDDRRFAKIVSSYWINFAKTGNPNGDDLPPWAAFDPGNPRAMHFGKSAVMGPVDNRRLYDFWDEYVRNWK